MTAADRTRPVPPGYTHVELPKPQAHGWGQFWGTLDEAFSDAEWERYREAADKVKLDLPTWVRLALQHAANARDVREDGGS